MKLTKDELTKSLEICGKGEGCEGCPMDSPNNACTDILLKNALCYLKENEPAPSGNDTSSNHKNTTTLDDTAKLEICQEKLLKIWGRNTDVLGHCIDICDMIHSVSEMIRTVLDVLNDLEKLGDTNAN